MSTSTFLRSRFSNALIALVVMLSSVAVVAAPYDIQLRGLGRPEVRDSLSDPAIKRFRYLVNELGTVIAPRVLAPADTLGMSGFEFTMVSTFADISESEDWWTGQPGSPVFQGVNSDGRGLPRAMFVPTVHIRKGLPYSVEVGVTGSYLAYSSMFSLGAEIKTALYESYYRWVPALATRLAFGTLFGTPELTLTTAEFDVLASLPIGLGGVAQLNPYVGGGLMVVDATSGLIDETPWEVDDPKDQRGGPTGSLYTFPRMPWYENRSVRIFAGTKLKFYAFALLLESSFVLLGPSDDMLSSHSIKFGFDI